jgi:hypothetical protein
LGGACFEKGNCKTWLKNIYLSPRCMTICLLFLPEFVVF